MVDVKELVREVSEDEIREKISGGSDFHPFYHETKERAEIMEMFYNSVHVESPPFHTLSKVLKRSAIESDEDYTKRLERTPIIPFEKMFVRAKERIFQGHGVTRELPDNDFWNHIQKSFDDDGESIDSFFRDKVFHYKEVLGYAGVVVDLLVKERQDPDTGEYVAETYTDASGEPVPYAYLVRPEEIYDFEMRQGQFSYLIIRKAKEDGYDFMYYAYTPSRVYKFGQELEEDDSGDVATSETLTYEGDHPFQQVPFVPIKGEQDMESGFKVGRPQRYSLLPMYKMAIEIAYDLQEVSLLYAHPIPVMTEDQVKQLIGAVQDDGAYNPENISAQLGAIVQIPDNQDIPEKLFFQADTQGLQHLKDYLFEIIEVVHKFASIRDKTQVVSNVSGIAKALDTVEERGVLASASREMESTERKVLSLFAACRGDQDFEDDAVQYQKEFDLSTASEHLKILIEGSAQNALTFEMYKYHALESLRKSGAPETQIDDIEDKLDEVGKPIRSTVQEIVALIGTGDRDLVESMSKHINILKHFLEKNAEFGSEPNESEDEDESEDSNPQQNEIE